MSSQLTVEQEQTILALRAEVDELYAKDKERWAAMRDMLKNGTRDFGDIYTQMNADWGEAQLKELIAHVPQAGERKIGSILKKIDKLNQKGTKHARREAADLQARVDALNVVNEWRESMGLPLLDRLPRGIIGNAEECTLARALKIDFNGGRELRDVSVGGGGEATVSWRNKDDGPYTQESANPFSRVANDNPDEWMGANEHGWHENYAAMAAGTVVSQFDEGHYPDLVEVWDALRKTHQLMYEGESDAANAMWLELVRRSTDSEDIDHEQAKFIVAAMTEWFASENRPSYVIIQTGDVGGAREVDVSGFTSCDLVDGGIVRKAYAI